MQRNSTLSEEIDSELRLLNKNKDSCLQPSNNTLKKILQFAASYKAVKIADNNVIDICLN